MKTHLSATSLAVIVMLAACNKKDDTTENTTVAIEGTFKLNYITSQTSSSVTSSYGDKAVTTTDYTTTNNQGTITLKNSTLTATGFAYSIDAIVRSYLYDGADLIDSLSYPFLYTQPASTSVAKYQLIGADSIYFPEGSVTTGVNGTGSAQDAPSGGRYSLNGNILTITQHYSRDSTFDDSGETIHEQDFAVSSMIMEKQ